MRILAASIAAFVASGAATAQSGPWQSVVQSDPITDETSVIAVTQANDYIALFIGCTYGTIYAGATTTYFDVEFGDFRTVTWRVDDNDPVSEAWENLERGGAAVYGEPGLTFARQVRQAKNRVVVKSGSDTQVFSVRGSTAEVGKVLDACGKS